MHIMFILFAQVWPVLLIGFLLIIGILQLLWGLPALAVKGFKVYSLLVLVMGIGFLVTGGGLFFYFDAHNVHALQTASATRYGVNLTDSQAHALFGENSTSVQTAHGTITQWGTSPVLYHGRLVSVSLYQLDNGTYTLETTGSVLRELAVKHAG